LKRVINRPNEIPDLVPLGLGDGKPLLLSVIARHELSYIMYAKYLSRYVFVIEGTAIVYQSFNPRQSVRRRECMARYSYSVGCFPRIEGRRRGYCGGTRSQVY
jgi:hypothetical protein